MKIQDFSNRSIENGLIHDTSPFHEVNLYTCPLCHSDLWSCQECEAVVACSDGLCAGSYVVGCEQCHKHECMSCHDCLDSKEPVLARSFVPCPTCNDTTCRDDLNWCPGSIVHSSPERELVKLSPTQNFDSTSFVRSHSPVPGPCRFCTNRANAWRPCNGIRTADFPFRRHSLCELGPDGAYCPDCITEHKGRQCACGAVWLCDSCSVADSPDDPSLISCPRCGTLYCTEPKGCQYSYFCSTCRRACICVGCRAREKGDLVEEYTLGEGSELLNGYKQCAGWHRTSYICNECCSAAKDGVTQCSHCHRWICGRCADGGELCPICICLQ